MTILYNANYPTTNFSNVKTGEFFYYSEEVYIKVMTQENYFTLERNTAVNLLNGELIKIDINEKVVIINGTLEFKIESKKDENYNYISSGKIKLKPISYIIRNFKELEKGDIFMFAYSIKKDEQLYIKISDTLYADLYTGETNHILDNEPFIMKVSAKLYWKPQEEKINDIK